MEEKADSELFSYQIKELAGFGKGGEKGFEGVMTNLQMSLYLCNMDFRQKRNKKGVAYGWPIAIYCTPEHLFGKKCVAEGYQELPQASWERIAKHMDDIYPIATKAQIKKVLGN